MRPGAACLAVCPARAVNRGSRETSVTRRTVPRHGTRHLWRGRGPL